MPDAPPSRFWDSDTSFINFGDPRGKDAQFAEAGPTDSTNTTTDEIVRIGSAAARVRLTTAADKVTDLVKKKRPT